MANIMILINVFLTPFTGFSLFLKRKEIDFSSTSKILLCYILFLTWNIPFTKLFIVLARKIGLEIMPDSSLYTLFALISSILVYGCYVLLSDLFHITFTVEKKNEE